MGARIKPAARLRADQPVHLAQAGQPRNMQEHFLRAAIRLRLPYLLYYIYNIEYAKFTGKY